MVRVFLGFADDAHRVSVVDALEALGPWPDAELIASDGGAYVECHGYDMAGAEALVQRRLFTALAGTQLHPDGVCMLPAPPRPGEPGSG